MPGPQDGVALFLEDGASIFLPFAFSGRRGIILNTFIWGEKNLDKRIEVIVSVFLLWMFFLCTAASAAESGRLAYVPNEGDNNLMIIDLQAERVIKTLPTGKTPHALAFTKQGKCYVNNRGRTVAVMDTEKDMINAQDGMMNKIDVSRMEVVSKIAVGNSAMNFGIKEGEEFPGTE